MTQRATAVFSVPSSRAAKRRMWAFFGKWWWAFALPLGALCAAGLYDWRYAFVALALLMVCMPAVLAFAYFQCALTPDAALGAVPHHIVFGDDALTVHYHRKSHEAPIAPRRYEYAHVVKIDKDDPDYVLIVFKNGEIELPREAMDFAGCDHCDL